MTSCHSKSTQGGRLGEVQHLWVASNQVNITSDDGHHSDPYVPLLRGTGDVAGAHAAQHTSIASALDTGAPNGRADSSKSAAASKSIDVGFCTSISFATKSSATDGRSN